MVVVMLTVAGAVALLGVVLAVVSLTLPDRVAPAVAMVALTLTTGAVTVMVGVIVVDSVIRVTTSLSEGQVRTPMVEVAGARGTVAAVGDTCPE